MKLAFLLVSLAVLSCGRNSKEEGVRESWYREPAQVEVSPTCSPTPVPTAVPTPTASPSPAPSNCKKCHKKHKPHCR